MRTPISGSLQQRVEHIGGPCDHNQSGGNRQAHQYALAALTLLPFAFLLLPLAFCAFLLLPFAFLLLPLTFGPFAPLPLAFCAFLLLPFALRPLLFLPFALCPFPCLAGYAFPCPCLAFCPFPLLALLAPRLLPSWSPAPSPFTLLPQPPRPFPRLLIREYILLE